MVILQRNRTRFLNNPHPDDDAQLTILETYRLWIQSCEKIYASLTGTVDPNTGLRS